MKKNKPRIKASIRSSMKSSTKLRTKSRFVSLLLFISLLFAQTLQITTFAADPPDPSIPSYSGNFTTSSGLGSDGFVSDEVWNKINWTAMPYSSNTEAISSQFKMVRITNSYYFLIDVTTNNLDNIQAYSLEKTTAGNFWNQDCVEIFLNEDPNTVLGTTEIGKGAEAYRHIRVNAEGVISEGNFGSGILSVTDNSAKVDKTATGFRYQLKLVSRTRTADQVAENDASLGVELFAYNTADGGAWNYWAIDRATENANKNWSNVAPSVTTAKFGLVSLNTNEITVSDSGVKKLDGYEADSNGVDLQTARVDSSVWDQIALNDLPYSNDSSKISSRFKMVRINNVYYFMVDVITSNQDDIKAYSVEQTTASNFWNQDCVELFLNEDPDTVWGSTQIAQNPPVYRHIRVNADGVIGEGNFGSGDPKISENYAYVTPTAKGFLYEIAVRSIFQSSEEMAKADNQIGLEVFAYNTAGAWNYWAIDRTTAKDSWSQKAPSVTSKYFGLVTTNANHLAVNPSVNAGQTTPNPTAIILNPDNLKLKEGTTQRITPQLQPFLANSSLSFDSSDKNVATIDTDGTIHALSGGSATITVTAAGGQNATCELTVEPLFVVPGTPDYIGKTETTDYTPPKSMKIHDRSYTLKFFDGFNGTSLDATKWDYMPEWQTKEGFYQDDSVSVEDGKLVLTQYISRDVDEKKATQLTAKKLPTDYYLGGAGLQTKGRFAQTYGYYEISMKIPYTQGYWAAFWLLNDSVDYVSNSDQNGKLGCELDIFEAFPNLFPKVHTTNHFSAQSVGVVSNALDFYDSYHTISCEWYPDDYIIYIDGKQVARMKSAAEANEKMMEICQNPLYICITTEFGGGSKVDMDKVKWINDSYGIIDKVYVDYVRAYSLDDALNANNRTDVEGSGYEMLSDISSGIYYGEAKHPIDVTTKEEFKPVLWNIQGMEGLTSSSDTDHLVLSSPYILDFKQFDQQSGAWATSALRNYLNSSGNDDFLAPSNFTAGEVDAMGETDVKIYQNDGTLLDAGKAKMYLKGHNGEINSSTNASMKGTVGNAVIWSSLGNKEALMKGSSYTAWADLWFTTGCSYRSKPGTNVNHYLLNPAGRENAIRFVAYGNAHPDLDDGASILSTTMATSPLFKLHPKDIVFASKILPETHGNPMVTQAVEDRYEAYNYKLTVKDTALDLSLNNDSSTEFIVKPGASLPLLVETKVKDLSGKTIVYKIVDRDNWLCGYGVLPLDSAKQEIAIPTVNLWKSMSSTSPDYSLKEQKYTVYLWEQENHEFKSHSASDPIIFTMNVSSASIPATHQISVLNTADDHGTVTVSTKQAVAGTLVSLEAQASNDYHFVRWEVLAEGKALEVANDSFTMPDYDVYVRAVFEKDSDILETPSEKDTSSTESTPSDTESSAESASSDTESSTDSQSASSKHEKAPTTGDTGMQFPLWILMASFGILFTLTVAKQRTNRKK